jgi:hypothetical protein
MVAARRGQPDAADGISTGVAPAAGVWSGGTGKAHTALSPACKRGCRSLQ